MAERLRSTLLSPSFPVALIVDDAPYDSVVAVLDAVKKIGIDEAKGSTHAHVPRYSTANLFR